MSAHGLPTQPVNAGSAWEAPQTGREEVQTGARTRSHSRSDRQPAQRRFCESPPERIWKYLTQSWPSPRKPIKEHLGNADQAWGLQRWPVQYPGGVEEDSAWEEIIEREWKRCENWQENIANDNQDKSTVKLAGQITKWARWYHQKRWRTVPGSNHSGRPKAEPKWEDTDVWTGWAANARWHKRNEEAGWHWWGEEGWSHEEENDQERKPERTEAQEESVGEYQIGCSICWECCICMMKILEWELEIMKFKYIFSKKYGKI